jgi:DNA-binding NarL/FixJ family response regulator
MQREVTRARAEKGVVVLIDCESEVQRRIEEALAADSPRWRLLCWTFSQWIAERLHKPEVHVVFLGLSATDRPAIRRTATVRRAFGDIPLIVLLSEHDRDTEVNLFFAGASGCLLKPPAVELLRSSLSLVIRGLYSYSDETVTRLLKSFQEAFYIPHALGLTH